MINIELISLINNLNKSKIENYKYLIKIYLFKNKSTII